MGSLKYGAIIIIAGLLSSGSVQAAGTSGSCAPAWAEAKAALQNWKDFRVQEIRANADARTYELGVERMDTLIPKYKAELTAANYDAKIAKVEGEKAAEVPQLDEQMAVWYRLSNRAATAADRDRYYGRYLDKKTEKEAYVKRKNDNIASLRDQKSSKEKEIADAEAKRTEWKKLWDDAQLAANNLAPVVKSAWDQITIKEKAAADCEKQACATVKARIDEHQADVNAKNAALQKEQADLSRQNAQFQKTQSQYNAAKASVNDAQTAVNAAQTAVNNAQANLGRVLSNPKASQKAKNSAQAKVNALQIDLNRANAILNGRKANLPNSQRPYDAAKASITRAEAALAVTTAQKNAAQSKLDEAHADAKNCPM